MADALLDQDFRNPSPPVAYKGVLGSKVRPKEFFLFVFRLSTKNADRIYISITPRIFRA